MATELTTTTQAMGLVEMGRRRKRLGRERDWAYRMKKIKVWKPLTWVRHSKNEYQRYKKTKDLKLLAQSGEKLWNAFNLYADRKLGKEFFSFKSMDGTVRASKDKEFVDRYDDALWLHAFFYRGYTDHESVEERKWQDVYDYLRKRVG